MDDYKLQPTLNKLLSAGFKLEAIKYVRDNTFRGLREARDYVEHFEHLRAERLQREHDNRCKEMSNILAELHELTDTPIDIRPKSDNQFVILVCNIALFELDEYQTINYLQATRQLLKGAQ